MKINPKVNMKLRSRKWFEACLVIAIILHVGLLMAFKKFEPANINLNNTDTVLDIMDIPETEQVNKPPPPAAPSVPVESEDEDLIDDVTIEDTEFDIFDISDAPPPPPMMDVEEIPPFLPFEDQPKLIGGLAALQKLVKYPEIAKKAGIQGQIIIEVLVDKEGVPRETKVLKSLGNNGCDEAAIKAIMQVRFRPAQQRNKPVPFRISIPITFKLKSGGGH